jgi:hypothetical protein
MDIISMIGMAVQIPGKVTKPEPGQIWVTFPCQGEVIPDIQTTTMEPVEIYDRGHGRIVKIPRQMEVIHPPRNLPHQKQGVTYIVHQAVADSVCRGDLLVISGVIDYVRDEVTGERYAVRCESLRIPRRRA